MPRTKKSTTQEADAATIADPPKREPKVDTATASEAKNDHKDDPNKKEGAQATAATNAPAGAPGAGATAAPARKPLGTKEVIPFAWKVIGLSGEMVLTLFKSIEKEDSEAHLARLGKDGAYKDLRLVEADFKIVQPKSVRAVLAANEKKNQDDRSAQEGQEKEDKGDGPHNQIGRAENHDECGQEDKEDQDDQDDRARVHDKEDGEKGRQEIDIKNSQGKEIGQEGGQEKNEGQISQKENQSEKEIGPENRLPTFAIAAWRSRHSAPSATSPQTRRHDLYPRGSNRDHFLGAHDHMPLFA